MARRFAPLSPRQVKVLRWVADGCPDGVWPDFSYKVTVYALADRGLVTVNRRRHSWQAGITDHGRGYLDHGADQYASARGSGRTPARPPPGAAAASRRGAAALVTSGSLLAELDSAGGTVTVPDPPGPLRAVYRSAISLAITEGLVPDGYGLRHTGRDHGDLVIRLIRVQDEPPRSQPLPAITVPQTLQGCHVAVAALRDRAGLLDVSAGVQERALLIAQAIAAECSRRGWGFGLPDDGQASFQITVGDDLFSFTLSEELERREVPDPQKLAAAKYAWQRIPSSVRQVPSGRLMLRLDSGYRSVFWADRRRWTLTEKLPEVFEAVATRASVQAGERRRKEEERQQRREAWEQAIPRARQAYIDQLNRDRLTEQVARTGQAEAIRGYCARLDALAQGSGDPGRAGQIWAWAAWARREADRLDPLRQPGELTTVVPPEVKPSDLQPFMPRGFSAGHPPD